MLNEKNTSLYSEFPGEWQWNNERGSLWAGVDKLSWFFFCIENQQANLTLNITVIQVTRLDSKIVIGLILAQLLGF